jgi:V8-like Glu-specific endopeptidase
MRELSIPSLCGALLFAATSGCAATGDESTEERTDEAQQDVWNGPDSVEDLANAHYPYVVAWGFKDQSVHCSGTLISPRWVLTASTAS